MEKREGLLDRLGKLRQGDPYPLHMPGHKRIPLPFPEPYSIDITEIDGFDNLHQPQGILKELEERFATLYDCDICNLSVGGSTDMLLTAITAATEPGDSVILARNCHKSVYHGAILRQLKCSYIYPPLSSEGICGPIDPQTLEKMLASRKGEGDPVRAFVLTSPTYEGVCSDVERISEVCHRYGVILIVDAAHGAHLGLRKERKRLEHYFPENPIHQGADGVILSLHKTLPSFTQTAALLMNNNSRIPRWKVDKYFDYFETSSPSYLLMGGMDACCRFLEEEGEAALREYVERLQNIRRAVSSYTKVGFWEKESWEMDPGKLVITGEGLSGGEIMEQFRKKEDLELEMCSLHHALAMTSVMDTVEGYDRLLKAMEHLQARAEKEKPEDDAKDRAGSMYLYDLRPKAKLPISCSENMPIRWVNLEDAKGCMAGGLWSVYPPGIPLLVPGEIVGEDIIERLGAAGKEGLTLDGCRPDGRFPVIQEDERT